MHWETRHSCDLLSCNIHFIVVVWNQSTISPRYACKNKLVLNNAVSIIKYYLYSFKKFSSLLKLYLETNYFHLDRKIKFLIYHLYAHWCTQKTAWEEIIITWGLSSQCFSYTCRIVKKSFNCLHICIIDLVRYT